MNKKYSLTLTILIMMHAVQVKAADFDHQKWLAFYMQQFNEPKNLCLAAGIVGIVTLYAYLHASTKITRPISHFDDPKLVYENIERHRNYILSQKKQYFTLKSTLTKAINELIPPPNIDQDKHKTPEAKNENQNLCLTTSIITIIASLYAYLQAITKATTEQQVPLPASNIEDQNKRQAKWKEVEKLLKALNELSIVSNTKVGRLKDIISKIQKITGEISKQLRSEHNNAARSLLLPEYEKDEDTLHNAINLTMRTFKRDDTIDTILHSYLEKAQSTFKNGTIMTYEAWVGAEINNRFSWQKYLNYFEKKQCENHNNLHIGAMIIPEDCTLHIIGDVHAAAESIQSIMQKFINEGIMDQNCKIKDPAKHKVIFIGDLVDKGWHTIETLIFLSHLKAVNEEEAVLFLRGNHDDKFFYYNYTTEFWTQESFVNELQARIPNLFEAKTKKPTDQGKRLLDKIDNFFSKMVCLYLLKKNKSNYDVLQFFHAAPDPVYHPKALFEHAIKRGENRLAFEAYPNNIFNNENSEIKQHTEYKTTYFDDTSADQLQKALEAREPSFCFVSFLWGSLEQNGKNHFFQYTGGGGAKIKLNEQMIKALRKEQFCTINGVKFSVKAMVRGHQHCYKHKIDKDRRDYNDTMTIMENIIKDGYSHWLSEDNRNHFAENETNIFTVPPLISNLYGAPSNVHGQDGIAQPGLQQLRITKIKTFDKLESVMVQ